MNNSKNVLNYMFGKGALNNLELILNNKQSENKYVVYFVDEYFKDSELFKNITIEDRDEVFFVQTKDEPKTKFINEFRDVLVSKNKNKAGKITIETSLIGNYISININDDGSGLDILKLQEKK